MSGNPAIGTRLVSLTTFVFAAILSASAVAAAPPDLSAAASSKTTLSQIAPHVFALKAQTRMEELMALSDTDFVQASNGKQVPVSLLHTLQAIHDLDRQPRPRPALIMRKIAANAVPKLTLSATQSDFGALLQMPNETVLSTPSGRRFTVEQLRLLQPQIEQHLGRPLASLRPRVAPNDGPVHVIARGEKLDAALKLPDTTVLQSPTGKRISVGELRQYVHDHPSQRSGAPKPGHAVLDVPQSRALAYEPSRLPARRTPNDAAAALALGVLGIGEAQADLVSTIDEALSLLEKVMAVLPPPPASPLPFSQDDVQQVHTFIDSCFGQGKGLQACIDSITPDQFHGDIGLIFSIIKDLGPPVSYGDLLVDAGELFICAGAQLIFDFDVCALLKDLIAVAEGVYDAAKAVVDFAEDVGCAIIGCDSHSGDNGPTLAQGQQLEQQYYAPHLHDALGVIETCTDEPCKAFTDWLANLEASFPPGTADFGQSQGAYDYQRPWQGRVHDLFLDQLTGVWTVDLIGKLLAPVNGAAGRLQGERDQYKAQALQDIPLNIASAENALENCAGWFESPGQGLIGNYDYWFYYGHTNDKATVDAQRAKPTDGSAPLESNQHWCQNTFSPLIRKSITDGIAQHYVDLGCPLSNGSQTCVSAAADSACNAYAANVQKSGSGQIHINPQCVIAKSAVDADMASQGCPASGSQYRCASSNAYSYCQAYAMHNALQSLPNGMQCAIDPSAVANATLAELNAVKPGSCSLASAGSSMERGGHAGGLVITCKRDLKYFRCQGMVSAASGAVSCQLDRPLDPPYNDKYNFVSAVLQGKTALPPEPPAPGGFAGEHVTHGGTVLAEIALPSPQQWKRVDQDPLVVLVPSGITAKVGGSAPNDPGQAGALQALQRRLDAYAAVIYPGHADGCHSEPDTEDDGQEMFQLCATFGVVTPGSASVVPMTNAMTGDARKTGLARAVFGTASPTPTTAPSPGGSLVDGGSFKEQITTEQSLTQQKQLQMQSTATVHSTAAAVTGTTLAGAGTLGAPVLAGSQQQSQALNAKLPNTFGPPPPPPPAGMGVAIRVDGARAMVTSGGAASSGAVIAPAEGATVACPAELTVAAAALIPQAGAFTFESYLLAPDGSKQNWVHGIPLMAQAPLPYHAQTHGSYVLAGGSFNQTMTLVMNISMNGQNTHLEVPQHFSVVCQGARR